MIDGGDRGDSARGNGDGVCLTVVAMVVVRMYFLCGGDGVP